MENVKNNIRNNFFYVLISKPNIYLKVLLKRTLFIGILTLLINLVLKWFNVTGVVPTTMHSVIGLVIGLLLVFRVNTAYDRWWEGRKLISNLSQEIDLISSRLSVMESTTNPQVIVVINEKLDKLLINLRDYLQRNEDKNLDSLNFHLKQKKIVGELFTLFRGIENHYDYIAINNSLTKIIEHSNSLERIKNTPIPLSYVLHIKISLLIYLITLPFGLFHNLGLFAIPMVMLLYYIIAGVEIISTEIENPFANDPNDLPIDKLFDDMSIILKDIK